MDEHGNFDTSPFQMVISCYICEHPIFYLLQDNHIYIYTYTYIYRDLCILYTSHTLNLSVPRHLVSLAQKMGAHRCTVGMAET